MAKNLTLVRVLLASGLALGFGYGCGEAGLQSTGFLMGSEPPQLAQTSEQALVTLYFDGDEQVFNINDLAVATALTLDSEATVPEIQQIASDIFGLTLTSDQITGAGSNPLANFDLNDDGIPGGIQDLGVAIGLFLDQTSHTAINDLCEDLLGQSCGLTASSVLPIVGSTESTPTPTPTPPSTGPGGPGGGILPEETPPPPRPRPPAAPPIATVVASPEQITFEAGTRPGATQFLTVSPTASPAGGDLVVRVRITQPDLISIAPDNVQETTITFIEGSTSPRNIVLTRQLVQGAGDSVVVSLTRDESTTAANFPEGSFNTLVTVRLDAVPGTDEEIGIGSLTVTPEAISFGEGTTIGTPRSLALIPSDAPQDGDLVLNLRSNSRAVNFFNSVDNATTSEITVRIRQGSRASQNVVLIRQIEALQSANAVITITVDATSSASNFPIGSLNRNVLVELQASPSEPPRVEPSEVLIFAVEQITLQAEIFRLTQTGTSGVLGYGTTTGSSRLSSFVGIDPLTVPKFPLFPGRPPGPSGIIPEQPGCEGALIGRPGSNFAVFNESTGSGSLVLTDGNLDATFEQPGTLDPRSLRRSPLTLSGQRLFFFRNTRNNQLFADIAPSNFDQIYQINFFDTFLFPQNRGRVLFCDPILDDLDDDRVTVQNPDFDPSQPEGPNNLPRFDNGGAGFDLRQLRAVDTQIILRRLRSANRLLTLRGTAGGINEPDGTNNGRLFGPQFISDRPVQPLNSNSLLNLVDPRFAGVQNQRDVSSNQLRTDIAFVFDQIRDQPTEAAIRDQSPFSPVVNPSIDENGNFSLVDPASQIAPNINPSTLQASFSNLTGRGSDTCPANATNNIVCGRFQFNQPFFDTVLQDLEGEIIGDEPDVLLIQGTFFGLAVDLIVLDVTPSLTIPTGEDVGVISIAPSAAPEGGDVVLSLSVDSDLVELSTQEILFPAGSTAPQMVMVNRNTPGLGTATIQIRLETNSRATNARSESIDTTIPVTLQ